MTQVGRVWNFTRFRLDQALDGLTQEQLAWRLYPAAHSVLEIGYHIAGCEHYWAARLMGKDPSATQFEALLDLAAVEGFLREGVGGPFRAAEHQTPQALRKALDFTAAELRACIETPTEAQLATPLVSPIGDNVTGEEGLVRLAQHAGYHTGQIWMICLCPGFPQVY